jgi:hypothetical protein
MGQINLIRLNFLLQRIILFLDDLELVFGVLYHFLQDLNFLSELFLGHLIQTVLRFEFLLIVDGDCSAGTELVFGNGAGGQRNDVEVIQVHFMVFGGHFTIKLSDYHSVKFFELSAGGKYCEFIIGLFSDWVEGEVKLLEHGKLE